MFKVIFALAIYLMEEKVVLSEGALGQRYTARFHYGCRLLVDSIDPTLPIHVERSIAIHKHEAESVP